MAGVLGSFAEAAEKTLPEMCGLTLSKSTVQRVTERLGAAAGAKLAAGETFGAAKDWRWSKDADGQTFACVSADLTGVGMQGPKGALYCAPRTGRKKWLGEWGFVDQQHPWKTEDGLPAPSFGFPSWG